MNVKQEEAKKMSRILRIVIRAFYWVSLVGAALLAISLIVVFLLPEKYFILSPTARDNMGFSIDGLIRYSIGSHNAVELSLKPIYQAICFMAAIIAAGLSVIFKQISNILKTVENDRPFSEENSRGLTIIGIVLIIGSFVFKTAEGIVASAIIHTLDIQNINVNYSIDGFMMLSGFLMLILAGVFKYGNYLQQEYDATL